MRGSVALAALAALALAAPVHAGLLFKPRHAPVRHTATRIGDWKLEIARNAFSGGIACRLRSRDHTAFYRNGAIAFRFKRGWNVAQAVYRLDGGQPRVSRDDLPDLVSLGAPIDRGGMDNPTSGIVWIPFARLAEANSVAIEPRPDKPAKVFHFRGLRALREIAVAQGCTPESSFVER